MTRLASALVIVTACLFASGPSRAEPPPLPRIAILFEPSAASLPQAEIRTAIAAELGVDLAGDPAEADSVLAIALDEEGGLRLSYRPVAPGVTRSIAKPPDPREVTTLIALLAGNLVRNEATDLLSDLRTDAASPPTPAPPPPPPPPPRAPPPLPPPAPTMAIAREPQAVPTAPRLLLMAGIGTGFGWSNGSPDVNPAYVRDGMQLPVRFSGVARAGAYHLAPEIAVLARPTLLVGAQLRLQHVVGTTDAHHEACGPGGICTGAASAWAVLARAGWLPSITERWRLLLSASLGLGRVRHLVDLGNVPLNDCGPSRRETCVDTVAGGAVLLGPGLAVFYDVGRRLSLYASLLLLAGVPDPMVNLDGALGVSVGL